MTQLTLYTLSWNNLSFVLGVLSFASAVMARHLRDAKTYPPKEHGDCNARGKVPKLRLEVTPGVNTRIRRADKTDGEAFMPKFLQCMQPWYRRHKLIRIHV